MANVIFNSTVLGRTLLTKLRRQQVGVNLTNRSYQGAITKYGDVVTIVSPTDLTIRSYNPLTDITIEEMAGTGQTLTIDSGEYFAFYAHDVLAASDYADIFAGEAADMLANRADASILARYADAAATVDTEADGIVDALREARKELSLAGVADQNRFAVVGPEEISALEASLMLRQTPLGDQVVRQGFRGQIFGFDVYESAQVSETAGTRHLLAGSTSAIVYADNVVEVEKLRSDRRFADQIRGLHIYGSKTVRPEALVRIDVAPEA